uniref:Anoctamin n=2 Tax=Eptatretus burgeri TaxID=7764 RepID=A0A8C4X015_EPTBU
MAEDPVLHVPKRKRIPWIITSYATLFIIAGFLCSFAMLLILSRSILESHLFKSGNDLLISLNGNIAKMTSSLVMLIIANILGLFYTFLAEKFNKWEMHRTQAEFEDALAAKIFIFQFFNFFSGHVYLAFFKGRFVGYPGHYTTFQGYRMEECPPGGCMIDLTQSVFVFLFAQMILGNLKELFLTKVMTWWHKRTVVKLHKERVLEQWEMDYGLLQWNGLLYEYLEIVIQFCFLTMFSVAFPPAPLLIMINNWIEIRLDAKKFLFYYQRPIPERVKDNGIFLTILTWIVHIAVLFHAALIAFSSDFLPRLIYYFTATDSNSSYLEFILAYSPQKYVNETGTPCR